MLDSDGLAMVEQFSAAAASVAWAYYRRFPASDVEELQGIAYVALVEAADRYPSYCRSRGYDRTDSTYHFAYVHSRMRGAILDWARAQDWMTRADRKSAKALDAAEEANPGAGAAELARAAGLTGAEADKVRAAKAGGPRYLEDELLSAEWSSAGILVDRSSAVESVAWVRAVLGATAGAFAALAWEQQVIVALVYVHGLPAADAAEALGLGRDQARRLHEDAVIALHDAQLAVAADGDGGCGCGNGNGSCGCGRNGC